MYQLGRSRLGSSGPTDLGSTDAVGLTLFLAGRALNAGSEMQRHRYKHDPSHAHRLFPEGCIRWIRHPNFPGDILRITGWALLTSRWESGLTVLGGSPAFSRTIPT